MKDAKLIHPGRGPIISVEPDQEDGSFSLACLQNLIGGNIEVISMAPGRWLVFDEDGKHKGLPRNDQATEVARLAGIDPGDFIAGPAMICTDLHLNGEAA